MLDTSLSTHTVTYTHTDTFNLVCICACVHACVHACVCVWAHPSYRTGAVEVVAGQTSVGTHRASGVGTDVAKVTGGKPSHKRTLKQTRRQRDGQRDVGSVKNNLIAATFGIFYIRYH